MFNSFDAHDTATADGVSNMALDVVKIVLVLMCLVFVGECALPPLLLPQDISGLTMRPVPKETHLLYSIQAVGVVFLFAGIITTGLSNSRATAEDVTSRRIFKHGDVIIGALVSHDEFRCGVFPTTPGSVEAIIFAIEEINKDKNLLPNVTLGYDIRDVCGDAVITAKQAFEFATAATMNCKSVRCTSNHRCICNDTETSSNKNFERGRSTYPVIAIAGMVPSRVAIPLANFLQAVRIPFVESTSTSEELSSPMYGSFFRTIPSDANQAKTFADIIEHYGWRYVAIVAVDDSYGRHGVIALERESNSRKTFCVELFGYIPFTDQEQKLKRILSSIKQRRTVQVIIVWSGYFYARELLRVAVKERLRHRIWIFSESLAAQKAEYLSSIHDLSSTGIHLGVRVQSKAPKFEAYLRGKLARNHSNSQLWKNFWDYLDKTNMSHKTQDQLLDIAYDDFAVYGIDVVFSIGHALDRMLRCKDPSGLSSSDRHLCPDNQDTLETGQLIEYLKRVHFKGVTGTVQFDSRGDPVEAIYEIIYFNISKINGSEIITKSYIGKWRKREGNESININDTLQWKMEKDEGKIPTSTCTEECKPGQWKVPTSECCWKCLPCMDGSVSDTRGAVNCTECTKTQMSNVNRTRCLPLPVGNIGWSDILAIIITTISVTGIIIDVLVYGILYYFRDTPIVKALNKVCTFALLFGTALSFGMTILYIARPSSALCATLGPLRYIAYTLCCSALFLKTMQIVHAFDISQYKNWAKAFICSTKRQVVVLLVMMCIEVALGASWIFVDPPYAHVTIIPKSHVDITCLPSRETLGKVLGSVMFVYLLLVAGCCIYYAFRARKLPANFNEAKHISFSLYIFLLSWITYYPVDYAAEGKYVAVLSGATLLLSSYGLLGCIFGPKLFIIVFHPEKNTLEFIRAEMRHSKASNFPSLARPAEESTDLQLKT